ncbi:unnamed protein product (macronuclear) [Paramecium tetraurelia]|uniref:TLDc domain-containing protein n=1 Tax=Paramecium tetraurelia TaxID=5888 RepID=A0CCS2_PARTE|nr:uncharacterized protein GSPATT00037374001 [Paramecium tetraurelia]CAK68589.1 unnamed protein product [Paramecium tetraurelia]|eukprot:XP_001435986.1 hypothetical protein (macronuclear) [Paramecium tetraurelia strain d4-2]
MGKNRKKNGVIRKFFQRQWNYSTVVITFNLVLSLYLMIIIEKQYYLTFDQDEKIRQEIHESVKQNCKHQLESMLKQQETNQFNYPQGYSTLQKNDILTSSLYVQKNKYDEQTSQTNETSLNDKIIKNDSQKHKDNNKLKKEEENEKIKMNKINLSSIYSKISPENLAGKIHKNLSTANFISFQLIYNDRVEKSLNQKIFEKIFEKIYTFGEDPLVCLAAEKQNTIVLVGCDISTQVFQDTKNVYLAQCQNNKEICWYYYQGRAFGFSPNKEVDLTYCDKFNPLDENRLCISLNEKDKERRIGILNRSEQISGFNLQIYILNI